MADTKLSALTGTSLPDLADLLYSVDVSDTTDGAGGSSRQLTLTRAIGLLNHVCQGRLTLTSGTPVTTSDVTSATSVYFTPFNGNMVALYDGTRWRMYSFTELTLALGTLTSGKNYDVFLYDNAGTLTLESLAWTNDTTRATALAVQDGVYVKTGATTRRYLGTFRTTSTTTTEDSAGGTTTQVGGKRFLWNMYNAVPRYMCVKDTSDNWTYATNTWRKANGASGVNNAVEYVCGLSLQHVSAAVHANGYGSGIAGTVGVGLDSTTSNSANLFQQLTSESNAPNATYRGYPGLGYHYLAWTEIARAGTITFQGDDGVTNLQSGLVAEVWG